MSSWNDCSGNWTWLCSKVKIDKYILLVLSRSIASCFVDLVQHFVGRSHSEKRDYILGHIMDNKVHINKEIGTDTFRERVCLIQDNAYQDVLKLYLIV